MTVPAIIPMPGTDIVPDGWADDYVWPWLQEQNSPDGFRDDAARLAGLEAAYKLIDSDTLEVVKARRYLEVRWGELLPPSVPGQHIPPSQAGEGLDYHERHRFRQLAEGGDKVVEAIRTAIDSEQISRASLLRTATGGLDAALRMSNSNEWYTPAKYIEAARELMGGGIDLDPATSTEANKRVRAAEIFTEADDGLKQRWDGRVWLNPPYGGFSGPFTAKLVDEYIADRVSEAVLLVNANSTDTAWFQPLWGYVLCFTDHRINFDSPTGAASGSTHGSVFAYLGANQDGFYKMFSPFGVVVRRYK